MKLSLILTAEVFGAPLNLEPKARASLFLLKPWPCPAHFSRVFSRTCWFCHPACRYKDISLARICMRVYTLPCSEVGKANIKQEVFFWSLHAVCMRLLRKTLARKVSLWIYKLSDIQGVEKRSCCLRNLRFATCLGWETEQREGVRSLLDLISHFTSNSPG